MPVSPPTYPSIPPKLFRKEKAIAFVQLLRRAIAPQSIIWRDRSPARRHRRHRTDNREGALRRERTPPTRSCDRQPSRLVRLWYLVNDFIRILEVI